MRPLSGRHSVGGFKITTLGQGGFAFRVFRVQRERRTSLTASLGCWHAYPVGVSGMLTLAPDPHLGGPPVGTWQYPGLCHGQ